jgi:uncharacterized protein (DUF433 family)
MDWSGCDIVEVVPGKVSGVPLIRNTRVPADTVLESAELGETPKEIAFNYDLRVDDVRILLEYANHRLAGASSH